MKKPKKLSPSNLAIVSVKIVDAVEEGIRKQMIRFADGDCFLYPEMLRAVADPKAYAKNLRLYARLKNLVKEDQTLFIKDIQNGDHIGFCRAAGQVQVYL